jgi:hypothetical protein
MKHTKPVMLLLGLGLAMTQQVPAHESKSFSAQGKNISYFNTISGGTHLSATDLTTVATVTVVLDREADVLVQFTSGVATEDPEGCPCTVRALLQLDDKEPVVVKRVNVGAPTIQAVDKYDADRQSADGSYVFALPAGKHTISLGYRQASGTSRAIEVYYPNLQALVFPKK